jgi:hypothetical protein
LGTARGLAFGYAHQRQAPSGRRGADTRASEAVAPVGDGSESRRPDMSRALGAGSLARRFVRFLDASRRSDQLAHIFGAPVKGCEANAMAITDYDTLRRKVADLGDATSATEAAGRPRRTIGRARRGVCLCRRHGHATTNGVVIRDAICLSAETNTLVKNTVGSAGILSV